MCHSYKPLVPKSESSLIVIFKAEMHWRGHVLRSKIHCVLSWKIIYSRHNLHNKYSLTSSFSPTTFAFFTRPVDPNLVSNGGWRVSSRDRGWPGEQGNVHGDISPCWAHVACSGPCCTAACHHNNFRRMFYFVFWGSNLVIPRVFVCLKAPTLPPAIWRLYNLREAVNCKLGRVSPIKGGGWGNSE